LRIRRTLLALAAIPALGLSLYGIQAAHGATAIHLPFPAGTAISIIQGYNGGTHQGVERYSLDLTRDDSKTSGSPALAPAAGTVVWSYPPGTQTGCIGIQIDGGDGLHEMLCHVILNHSYANGEHVGGGQVLGSVGAPGTVANNGVSHIHLQLYRIINGDRSPVPFASPDGVPLEGVSLPPSTGFSQWACSGDHGTGCHITSQNGAASAPSATPSGGTITSTSNSSTAGATVSSPRQAGSGLAIGVRVQVSGTGDCLRVHASASMSASQVYCLPDGTQAVISDGPQTSDGYTWYKLGDLGWSVADYLVPLNGGNSVPVPEPPIAPAAPAASAPSTATPVVTSPASVTTATAPSSAAPTGAELPIGVNFTVGSAVVVAGTGDCLNVHDQSGTSGIVVDCIPDGTAGTITDGPISANGYTWWRIDDRGWVVGDYLKSQ
jgi:hypothetical protein